MTASGPDEEVFPFAEAWTEEAGKVYLVGSHCKACGKLAFARRTICEACGETGALQPERLGSCGVVYSFSDVHVAPEGFSVPYVIAYVDFPGDVRVCGQVEPPTADLRIGDEVHVVLGIIRRRGERRVMSYKFRRTGATGRG